MFGVTNEAWDKEQATIFSNSDEKNLFYVVTDVATVRVIMQNIKRILYMTKSKKKLLQFH